MAPNSHGIIVTGGAVINRHQLVTVIFGQSDIDSRSLTIDLLPGKMGYAVDYVNPVTAG